MMLFEPQTGSFLYAQGVLAFDLNPVVITLYSAMVGPSHPGGLNWGSVFDLYGELLGGDISIESATLMGADLDGISFTQTSSYGPSQLLTKTYLTDPTIDGPWVCFSGEVVTFKALAFGCIGFTSVSTFSEMGFESQEFELVFLHLFGIPLDITLDYVFTAPDARAARSRRRSRPTSDVSRSTATSWGAGARSRALRSTGSSSRRRSPVRRSAASRTSTPRPTSSRARSTA